MQTINADDLIDMAVYADECGYEIEVMYADAAHPFNIFGQAVYASDAPLLLHKSFAPIVQNAAKLCRERSDYRMILHDGLRPCDRQQAIQETDLVRANPNWLQDIPGRGRLFSPPGRGAHPRGMAIDISLKDNNGNSLDCGTKVDEMSPLSARKVEGLSETAKTNRALLDGCMLDAAKTLDLPLFLLPAEWWDFRFPADLYNQYAPIPAHPAITPAA